MALNLRLSLLVVLPFLAACGPKFDGPSEKDIADFLVMQLDDGIAVEGVDIVAAQNVGDQIEPVYRTRSNVELVLEQDFAELVEYVGEQPVVKITVPKGTSVPAQLFTRAEPIGESWDLSMEKIDIRKIKGGPLSNFDDYVIEGSKDEAAARVAQKEMEKQAEREILAARDNARKSFFGTWKTSRPVMGPRGVWQSNGDPLTVEVNFKPGTDGAGTGTMTLKNINKKSDSATGAITYVIEEGEQRAVISVSQNIALPSGDSWITAPSTWYLYSGGRLELSNDKRWNIDLSLPGGV